jgi:hypothetical protein
MSVWYNVEASCPICAQRLRIRELGGGFALGQDSDLLVRMEGKHVVQAAIHTCLRCRFSGYSEDFGGNIPRALAQRFLAEVTPKLSGAPAGLLPTPPLPDVQYYWSYRSGVFLARADSDLGQRLLRAYWCLRLPPSCDLPGGEISERRKVYLVGATHHLRQAWRPEPTPLQLYMLGELYRKNSDYPTSVGYFKKFLDSSAEGEKTAPRYLRLAAMKLLRAAEHSDSRDKTMEEIVYADSAE